MRANISAKQKHYTAVILEHKDMVGNMCDTYAVESTQREDKVMILDPGAPVTLAGRPCLSKHLKDLTA